MDKRRKYNSSWENLKKGPIASKQKAKKNAQYNTCLNCKSDFKVYPSTAKRSKFCSQSCKNEGQSKGLTSPMRKGTGMGPTRKILSNKFDRYRKKDTYLDYTRSEFYKMIEDGSCFYCNSDVTESLGLDRIDNSKGHTTDNVLICCELCNTTRGHRFTVEQMKVLGKVIKTFKMDGWRMMGHIKKTS